MDDGNGGLCGDTDPELRHINANANQTPSANTSQFNQPEQLDGSWWNVCGKETAAFRTGYIMETIESPPGLPVSTESRQPKELKPLFCSNTNYGQMNNG